MMVNKCLETINLLKNHDGCIDCAGDCSKCNYQELLDTVCDMAYEWIELKEKATPKDVEKEQWKEWCFKDEDFK